MKRITDPLFLPVLLLFLLFLSFPRLTQQAAQDGLIFCGSVLIPSLFPGYVLSNLLLDLTPAGTSRSRLPLYRLLCLSPGAAECLWIGLLAGFPSAAECAVRRYGEGAIGKREAERCLAFTNHPGIVFVISAVGMGLFGSLRTGLLLWLSLVLSSLTVCVLFCDPSTPNFPTVSRRKNESWTVLFPRSVTSAVRAVLYVSGFTVFFRVLIAVFALAPFPGSVQAGICGVLELTCGLRAVSDCGFWAIPLSAAVLGWSGCSVHLQIMNVLADTDLSPRCYWLGKGIQGAIAPFFAVTLFSLADPSYSVPPIVRYAAVVGSAGILVFAALFRRRKESIYEKRSVE